MTTETKPMPGVLGITLSPTLCAQIPEAKLREMVRTMLPKWSEWARKNGYIVVEVQEGDLP